MKHPGYSKAKNQYAQRAITRLTPSSKSAFKEEMKRFNERLKKITSR